MHLGQKSKSKDIPRWLLVEKFLTWSKAGLKSTRPVDRKVWTQLTQKLSRLQELAFPWKCL